MCLSRQRTSFVVTKVGLLRQNICCNFFVVTKLCLLLQIFVVTRVLSRQNFCRNKHTLIQSFHKALWFMLVYHTKDVFCHDKRMFVVTNTCLSWQNVGYLWQLPPVILGYFVFTCIRTHLPHLCSNTAIPFHYTGIAPPYPCTKTPLLTPGRLFRLLAPVLVSPCQEPAPTKPSVGWAFKTPHCVPGLSPPFKPRLLSPSYMTENFLLLSTELPRTPLALHLSSAFTCSFRIWNLLSVNNTGICLTTA